MFYKSAIFLSFERKTIWIAKLFFRQTKQQTKRKQHIEWDLFFQTHVLSELKSDSYKPLDLKLLIECDAI